MLQVVLELCRSKQVMDRETVDMHLERIRNLVSTWAAQVSCPDTCLAVLSNYYLFFLSCFVSLRNVCVVFPLQPCFAEVEFPESTFVDQVELLLKDPEEKERYFQVSAAVQKPEMS